MANTGLIDVNANAAYASSFGILPNLTMYHTGANMALKAFDGRVEIGKIVLKGARIMQEKAYLTTSGGAGTAGQATVPVYVDRDIIDTSRKYTPLVELIPRVTNLGLTADYVRVTAKNFAQTYAEDAAFPDGSATRERQSKSIKYLRAVGRVTGQAQAAFPGYTLVGFGATGAGMSPGDPFRDVPTSNATEQEIQLAAQELKELEENLIVNGNITTSAISGNPDGTEYDGIIQQQSTTNQTDLSGAQLEWSDVENAIRDAYVDSGRPNLAVASPSVVTRLRVIMVDILRYTGNDLTSTISFGIPSGVTLQTFVGPVPVIASQFLSDTAAARRIYFLDMRFVEMRVLQDMTFVKMGINNDSDKFFLKIYQVLLLKAPEFNSNIIGIA